MARRPRGTCPVCRTTLTVCWSGEIRVLRRHGTAERRCPGSGRPALGELSERPAAVVQVPSHPGVAVVA